MRGAVFAGIVFITASWVVKEEIKEEHHPDTVVVEESIAPVVELEAHHRHHEYVEEKIEIK